MLPGRGNREIWRAVEKDPAAKTDRVIIAVSDNDLYRKNRTEEPLIREMMGVIDEAALKISCTVVAGIVPQTKHFFSA